MTILTTSKKLQSKLVTKIPPYYYHIDLVNHPNGVKTMCCPTEKHLNKIIKDYPDSTWEKIYLPESPQTVDIPYVSVTQDYEVPMQQKRLPENQQQPFNP